ncbi:MAG TPA: outer membrane beta-barrel protein [Candidatus Megaira endosymbiont of Hartmannula sinica]|nr:outer membrane beta-barrel protein [Candidatus Megaera endosymbiont of Hartmannula sinica]
MIKKILLTAATISMLSSSTIYAANEGDYYGKIGAGFFMANNENGKDANNNTIYTMKRDGVKGLITASAGYYLMDNIRTEVAIEHLFNPKLKDKNTIADVTTAVTINQVIFSKTSNAQNSFKYKPTALLLKGYIDMPVYEMVTLYAGLGLGVGRNSGEYTNTTTFTTGEGDAAVNYTSTTKASFKNSTSFAFGGYIGVAAEVSDGMFADLELGYTSYGKTGKNKASTITVAKTDGSALTDADNTAKAALETQTIAADTIKGVDLKGLSLRAGLRFVF